MDYEFLGRLHKAISHYAETKFSALLSTKDYGQMRELQGAIGAIEALKEIIAEANNPSKKQENKIAENEYNIWW